MPWEEGSPLALGEVPEGSTPSHGVAAPSGGLWPSEPTS